MGILVHVRLGISCGVVSDESGTRSSLAGTVPLLWMAIFRAGARGRGHDAREARAAGPAAGARGAHGHRAAHLPPAPRGAEPGRGERGSACRYGSL